MLNLASHATVSSLSRNFFAFHSISSYFSFFSLSLFPSLLPLAQPPRSHVTRFFIMYLALYIAVIRKLPSLFTLCDFSSRQDVRASRNAERVEARRRDGRLPQSVVGSWLK